MAKQRKSVMTVKRGQALPRVSLKAKKYRSLSQFGSAVGEAYGAYTGYKDREAQREANKKARPPEGVAQVEKSYKEFVANNPDYIVGKNQRQILGDKKFWEHIKGATGKDVDPNQMQKVSDYIGKNKGFSGSDDLAYFRKKVDEAKGGVSELQPDPLNRVLLRKSPFVGNLYNQEATPKNIRDAFNKLDDKDKDELQRAHDKAFADNLVRLAGGPLHKKAAVTLGEMVKDGQITRGDYTQYIRNMETQKLNIESKRLSYKASRDRYQRQKELDAIANGNKLDTGDKPFKSDLDKAAYTRGIAEVNKGYDEGDTYREAIDRIDQDKNTDDIVKNRLKNYIVKNYHNKVQEQIFMLETGGKAPTNFVASLLPTGTDGKIPKLPITKIRAVQEIEGSEGLAHLRKSLIANNENYKRGDAPSRRKIATALLKEVFQSKEGGPPLADAIQGAAVGLGEYANEVFADLGSSDPNVRQEAIDLIRSVKTGVGDNVDNTTDALPKPEPKPEKGGFLQSVKDAWNNFFNQ